MKQEELKSFLEEKVVLYNHLSFIDADPILIPHRFDNKEDIEIAGFLAAIIAWGNRKSIIKSGERLMELMGQSPYDYVLHATEKHIEQLEFVHRTFNSIDLRFFILGLRNIYKNHGGLEKVFTENIELHGVAEALHRFKQLFFSIPHPHRTQKHFSDPLKNSAAKRLNMYLRWMVRRDQQGVDFGLWKNISPSKLLLPLDVHTGNVARSLSLLKRKTNDFKALNELMHVLRQFDAADPVKYDFALFGLGNYEGFK